MRTILSAVIVSFCFGTMNAQWNQMKMVGVANNETGVYSLIASGNILYAGSQGDGIFRSTDGGNVWIPVMSVSGYKISYFAINDSTVFAGHYAGALRTIDKGVHWTEINTGLQDSFFRALTVMDGIIFVSTNNGIYRSMNNGDTWESASKGLSFPNVSSIGVQQHTLFAGDNLGIFRSLDSGISWNRVDSNFNSKSVLLVANENDLFSLSYENKLYRSIDSGYSWQSLRNTQVLSIAFTNNIMFVGDLSALSWSKDNGNTWLDFDTISLPRSNPYALLVFGNYLFLGGGGIWRLPISKLSVGNNSSNTSTVTLDQNYPNPFASNTTINFTLSKSSSVSLIIYDVLGNKAPLLESKEMEVGSHSITWDAKRFANGIYSYRLSADGITETKKLILLR